MRVPMDVSQAERARCILSEQVSIANISAHHGGALVPCLLHNLAL